MAEDVLKIAIAGFMHRIEKIVEASSLRALLEKMEPLLPTKLNQEQWGLEDSLIDLATGHQNPETPMQWIIAMADRISSGWDLTGFDVEYNPTVSQPNDQKTILTPIFEQLMRDDRLGLPKYCYSPQELSAGSIFPKANDAAPTEYTALFEAFVDALGKLLHREENLALWFEHFESLMMVFSSLVPAVQARGGIPDVPLFDHLKATSALAVALYLYHRDTGQMTVDAIKNCEDHKFLLVSGEFYGIHRFIFGGPAEQAENSAQILRGRSFAVSLFSELAAGLLCRKIGIPSISVILNATGKFTLIAPNTEGAKRGIVDTENEVNEWLFRFSFGENSLGIGFIEASPQEFVQGRLVNLWNALAQEMEDKNFRRIDLELFGGTVNGYLDNFRPDLTYPLCPFCGKRASSPDVEGSPLLGGVQSSCRFCRDHILLGTNLATKRRVAVMTGDTEIDGYEKLFEPLLGCYQIAFVDGPMEDLAAGGRLLRLWDISIDSNGKLSKDATVKFINGHVPVYDESDRHDPRLGFSPEGIQGGHTMHFRHIAQKALNVEKDGHGLFGVEALGVLKADVDQLELVFSSGLKPKMYTLPRLAAMSRQFNWFFAFYIPCLLKADARFSDVCTIFSGGDDLFLIGPWNRVIELTGFLHDRFEEYVCRNPAIHFSAGISLHKPYQSLGTMVSDSDKALQCSKNAGGNSVTLFSETIRWDQFMKLQRVKTTLEEWHEKKMVNTSMLYRLNDFIEMAGGEKDILSREEIPISEMECLKWRALFYYSVERNVGESLKSGDRKTTIEDFNKAAAWLEEFGGALKIALWDVLYNSRRRS